MKYRLPALLLFVTLAAAFALAPQLLRLEQVESAVVQRLRQELSQDAELENLRWHWWPVPHVSLRNLRLDGGNWKLTTPDADFYPAWRSILGRQGSAGRLILKQPLLQLKQPGPAGGDGQPPPPPRLPQLSIVIRDGTVSIAEGVLPPDLRASPLEISGLEGRLHFSGAELAIKASAGASFAREISASGTWRPMTGEYWLTLQTRGFMLHRAVASLAGLPIIPGESVVDFKADVQGRGSTEFRMDIKGRLPCLLVRPEDRQPLLITCGHTELSLTRSGSSLELAVRDLTVQDPSFRLQGRIRHEWTGQQPAGHWEIDLVAHDLDAARLREKALQLSSHWVVRQVTDILRAGHGPSVRLQFSGPAAGLARLENLTISGRLKDGEIMVPGVDLHLFGVTGDFSIREGVLDGSGLRARLGGSTGRNGSVLVSLVGERIIHLDLDLEANLSELSEALHKTVRHTAFLQEVDRFSGVAGRADGNLHLRYSPVDNLVRVQVHDFTVSGRYDRLAWPFTARGGHLDIISNRQVYWNTVSAELGPHRIQETSGTVSWPEILYLDIQSLQARLEAGPLFQELIAYPSIRRKLFQALTAVEGTLEVAGGSLSGPAHHPEQWTYQADGAARELSWSSPLLPGPVHTSQAVFQAGDREVRLLASENLLLGNPLLLQGHFRHHLLEHWHGWTRLNGTVEDGLYEWLRERDWIPASLLPRAPFTMQDLQLDWQDNRYGFKGAIIGGGPGSIAPRVDFKVASAGTGLQVQQLKISAAGEQARISLRLPGADPESRARSLPGAPELELSWEGELDGRTLDRLLVHNRLLSGRVGGNWALRYAPGDPQRTTFDGHLRAERLQVPAADPELPVIERLEARGEGNRLDISQLRLRAGDEEASGGGRVKTGSRGLEVDLELRSELLSWPVISRLRVAASRLLEPGGPESEEPGDLQEPSWDLRGRIRFDIARFDYDRPREQPADGDPDVLRTAALTYRWQPLRGSLSLQPDQSWSLDVDHADICGIIMTGSWNSGDPRENRLHLRSDPDRLPAFERLMPCLGIEQDLLVGNFSLDATLLGRPGEWTGGQASLRSEQGVIRRLRFLSRVFKVVNLTDLFRNGGDSGGGAHGIPYSSMQLETRVSDNLLMVEKAVVRGEGLNLFGRGRFDLTTFRADLTILIAPFKTIDLIVSKVPLLGRAVGGRYGSLVTIPVGMKGPISDPVVMLLPPEAVGESLRLLVREIMSLPFTILDPLLSMETDPLREQHQKGSAETGKDGKPTPAEKRNPERRGTREPSPAPEAGGAPGPKEPGPGLDSDRSETGS